MTSWKTDVIGVATSAAGRAAYTFYKCKKTFTVKLFVTATRPESHTYNNKNQKGAITLAAHSQRAPRKAQTANYLQR